MTLERETVLDALRRVRERSGKRSFRQGVDLSLALEGLDPKKPESRITLDVVLPHGKGRPNRILVFADGELARLAREAGADRVMGRAEIERLQGNRKEAKRLAREYDLTLAQADLMVLIGRVFGPVFGPRGKMPKPIPATADPVPLLERMRKVTRLMNKGQLNFQTKVGDESMQDEQLAENVLAVLEEVERKITDLGGRLRAIYLKTTMGEPVRLEAG